MPHGVRTPEEQELEFRKHYLVTGNASGSARAVGLPITTGQDLATRALADPEFVRAREEMRARVLPDAERMLISGLEIAMERLATEAPTPKELAALALEYGLKSASYQDPRPAYFRGMSAAVAALTGQRRLDAEKNGEITGRAVVIEISGPEDTAPDEPAPQG